MCNIIHVPCSNFLYRRSTIFGLSACVSQLRHGRVQILVLSADLKPRYVVNQIILLALAHNPDTRVLCLTRLNERLSAIVPFSCFCMAITTDGPDALRPLVDWCKAIIDQYHPNPNLNVRQVKKRVPIESSSPAEGVKDSAEMEDVSFDNLYLTKSTKGTRSFVPSNAIKSVQTTNDFISLGSTMTKSSDKTSSGADVAKSINKEIRDKLNLRPIEEKPVKNMAQKKWLNEKHKKKPNQITKHIGADVKYESLTVLKTQGNEKRAEFKNLKKNIGKKKNKINEK